MYQFQIQVPNKKAPIQLSKPKNQIANKTITQDTRVDKKTLPQPKFRSIFDLQWGRSELLREPIQAKKEVNAHNHTSTTSQCIQRSPDGDKNKTSLSTEHLNVVGEDHIQSSKRRKDEKEYAKIYSGSSNYWVEHQFLERPLTPDEKRQREENPSLFRDTRKSADSFKLQFFQALNFLESNAQILTKFEKLTELHKKGNDQGQFRDNFVQLLMDELEKAEYWIDVLAWQVLDLHSGKYDVELEGEEKKILGI